MLQTNLIGQQFEASLDGGRYTIVAVYVTDGNLILVGASDTGRLIEQLIAHVTLIIPPKRDYSEVVQTETPTTKRRTQSRKTRKSHQRILRRITLCP